MSIPGEMPPMPEGVPQPPAYAPNQPSVAPEAVPGPEDTPQPHVTWEAVEREADAAAFYTRNAFEARRKVYGKKVPNHEYDEEGRIVAQDEEHGAYMAVKPDFQIVNLVHRKPTWENIKEDLKARRIVRAFKTLLPDFIEEVPQTFGWTIARTETRVGEKEKPEPVIDVESEDFEEEAYFGGQEESVVKTDDVEEVDNRPKIIERLVLTQGGKILRFVGGDDTPSEDGRPLRFVPQNKADKTPEDKRDRSQRVLVGYRADNSDRFTSLKFKGEVKAQAIAETKEPHKIPYTSASIAMRGLRRLLEKSGVKAED
jgi:hypothetical protein